MKKHLIAIAVAAAVAAPAAMADTTLYGLAHLSVDYIDAGDYVKSKNARGNDVIIEDGNNLNIQSASSRVGVKGSEKLGNGLSAIYQMEFGVDMADSGTFSGRNQFVGLTGGFGTFILGRHDTPMKLAIGKYDLFGDQIGDNGNIVGAAYNKLVPKSINGTNVVGGSAGWNQRVPNVVAYITPNMGGFSATLAYSTDHDIAGASGSNNDFNDYDAYSLSAGYKSKMFDVTGAYEVHNALCTLSNKNFDEKSWMVGAGVNFSGVRVNALYQNMEDFENKEANVYGAGVSYTFGKNTIKTQYFVTDAEGKDGQLKKDRSLFALGYDYKMSKQTTLYAAYAMGTEGQSVWGDGHGGKTQVGYDDVNATSSADTSAFSVGVKHKF